ADVILDLNGHSIDRGTTQDVKNGEVFHVHEGAELTLKNGTIVGSVHIMGGERAVFENCVFKDNEDIDFGAAIFAEDCDEIVVENCTFSNLEDDSNGAAIEAEDAAITIVGSTFRNCTTEHDGGAIYAKNASIDMTNCQFTGNHAEGNGGAVACVDTELNVAGSTLGNNTADGNGGAMYLAGETTKTAEIYQSNFADNTAWENGGALAVEGEAAATMYGCIVDENTALENGGAVYAGQNAEFEALDYNDELARDIHPTKFINNDAAEKGDVIFIDTPDGGIEEGEAWVDPAEESSGNDAGFSVTDVVLILSAAFVAVTVVLNFRKPK
ncbi:MAG: right-handed parallel beta-helix repeat-containing protein, partial [Firmicutes bacterium]|nr:right-handed parallel beta-helix repeat-containing protein [Bacillota bacterium]